MICQALEMRFHEIKVRRDPKCPLCGDQPSITGLIDYEQFCGARSAPGSASYIEEVSVQEMQRALAETGPDIVVLDVREAGECELAPIAGTEWCPFSLLPTRCNTMNPTRTYYLFCRTGARSRLAAAFLAERGFRSVRHVRGGLASWCAEIDPEMIRF